MHCNACYLFNLISYFMIYLTAKDGYMMVSEGGESITHFLDHQASNEKITSKS